MKRKKTGGIRRALAVFCFMGAAVYLGVAFLDGTAENIKTPLFVLAAVFAVLGILAWPKRSRRQAGGQAGGQAAAGVDLAAARAELARATAALDALEQQAAPADNDSYIILAALDDETCEVCGDMDGRVFLASQYAEGLTAPPFHEGCRCCTVPYFEDMQGTGERAARDPKTGQTFYVPAGMTYKEYKKKYMGN